MYGVYEKCRITNAKKSIQRLFLIPSAELNISSSSSSKIANILVGPPDPPRTFITPSTNVVPRAGILSKLAIYSSRGTLFGCRYIWHGYPGGFPGSVEGVSDPTTDTCKKKRIHIV
jgi:hypothetical protein